MSVCNILIVDLLRFLFGVFRGMCDVNSCNVLLRLFMTLWVPISATLCRRAVLTLWHAFLFLGLRFFPLFFLLLGVLQSLHCFFYLPKCFINKNRLRIYRFLFGVLGGMCDVNSCNVFLLLFMVLWVPISATLFSRAVPMLWHAFLFLGLRFLPLFFLLLGGLHCFFL
jgi:hypothetical protein